MLEVQWLKLRWANNGHRRPSKGFNGPGIKSLPTYYLHIIYTYYLQSPQNIFMGWILVSYTFTIWEADVWDIKEVQGHMTPR